MYFRSIRTCKRLKAITVIPICYRSRAGSKELWSSHGRRPRSALCDCNDSGVHRVWMHQSLGGGSSVSPKAVDYCKQHDISVIAGACPMMYGANVDFGHRCMRWILRLTGGLPR